jgi:hypothetical protein
VVEQAVVRQTIDLKPAGNTVALTTSADNPFASDREVVIVTQSGSGMAPVPASMQSTGIMHRMLPGVGGLSADVIDPTRAPTQGPYRAPAPAAPAPKKDEGKGTDWAAIGTGTSNLLTTGANVFASREQRLAAEAQAKAAGYASAAEMAKAQAAAAGSNKTMIIAGVVGVLGIAGLIAFMMMKKK